MAFKLPINLNAIAQGVGGIAFGGGEHSSEDDDSGVERLLDRISNGVLAEDRRAALAELQPIVAESASAQMAFGAMGFPVLLSVLREEREDIEMQVKVLIEQKKKAWSRVGCTIMTDGWKDARRREFVNFLVSSGQHTVFLRSVDVTHRVRNASFMTSIIKEVIEEVGPSNVIQIITDNASACVKSGRELELDYPHIFWTPCAAHSLDLLLEDLRKLPWIREVVDNCERITKFIYGHGILLSLFFRHSKGKEISRPGATRFATHFLSLRSLLDARVPLGFTFISEEWTRNDDFLRLRISIEGVDVASLVKESHYPFWSTVEEVVKVRGSLETLVSALTPVDSTAKSSEVQPASMNSELLSREGESISLLLSLLSEDDFYIKYYTLQLLTALITNCCSRVQEAILATPRGITRLMDMLMDREVIRNEALLLLTYLTRDAEEIQKIVVFEGAFEKIFNIIKEEGGSEGGIVVQDCLELLNNLLRNNSTNQILLRETIGLQSVVSLLKLRKGSADGFSRQKTVNLLGVLETVALLLAGSSDTEHSKDTNRIANQSVFSQKKLLDCLIMLSVESRWAAVAIRSAAFRCIGDLIFRHSENRDALASKILGDGQDAEPALNSILRINLHTSSLQECWAAEHVFKCFCEGNPDGQMMLASTITPLPQSSFHGEHFTEDSHRLTFGSLLVRALVSNDSQNEPEAKGRAASILSHILKDNRQCKEWVLNIQLEIPVSSISSSELLMPRVVKHLAAVCPSSYSKGTSKQGPSEDNSMWLQVALLKLLVTWLADCPDAVSCFLQSPAHLAYIIDLLSGNCSSAKIPVTGLVVVLLGECIVFNKSTEDDKDAFMVVDAISQRIGLSTYFSIWDEMQRSPLFLSAFSASHQPRRFTRSSTSDTIVSEAYDYDSLPDNEDTGISHIDPSLGSFFDASVVHFIKELEPVVRSQIVELFSRPKSKVTIIPAELEQRDGESNDDYIMRLKSFVEKQCHEMQNLLGRNAALAEDMAKTRNDSAVEPDPSESGNNNRMQSVNGIKLRIESSTLRNELEEAQNKIEMLKAEKMKCESELSLFKQLAGKFEADLKSLSDAYNSLEQTNYRLELEIKSLRGEDSSIQSTLDAIKEEGRLEAQKESEAELNDLLVCLGQEQSKVEKLSARLTELGEDVETLLEGIGEEGEARDDNNEEEEQ